MKKIIIYLLTFVILSFGSLTIYYYIYNPDFIETIISNYKRQHTTLEKNKFNRYIRNNLAKPTNNFTPENKQDLLDIYYTVFASGMDEFTFFCSIGYDDCIDDIQLITEDSQLISHLNNFIHVYNSFHSVKTTYNANGRITIIVNKVYTDELIEKITNEIDELFPELVSDDSELEKNIKNVHDHIINITRYDVDFIDGISEYKSNTAYGPLFQGYGICSGYTDLMSLFLDRMPIIHQKVSNENHVWNMVYLNDEWLHIDLTWNDPVSSDGKDYLLHDSFLLTTGELLQTNIDLDKDEHEFDQAIYLH